MQEFLAVLSNPIDRGEFEKSWSNDCGNFSPNAVFLLPPERFVGRLAALLSEWIKGAIFDGCSCRKVAQKYASWLSISGTLAP